MKRILHVVGARPNFMKAAPIIREMAKYPDQFEQILVHTGQHYDNNMSQIFFDELELPKPNINLEVGSGSHAVQTAQIMLRFEPIAIDYKPDWVIVPGDVNSTMACTLVASKLGIKVAHVEAGLRAFDTTMPEEINRIVTDHLADLLLTPSLDANENLIREGVSLAKICFVGNIMIDTLTSLLSKAKERWLLLKEKLKVNNYILVTLHRPVNVDEPQGLQEILTALSIIGRHTQVVFPVHPRTYSRIIRQGFTDIIKDLLICEPFGYLDFLALQMNANLVITDSGGVQEETTYLGVPCLTIRPNTERPVTILKGTNRLVKNEQNEIIIATEQALNSVKSSYIPPELWDGETAKRIVKLLR